MNSKEKRELKHEQEKAFLLTYWDKQLKKYFWTCVATFIYGLFGTFVMTPFLMADTSKPYCYGVYGSLAGFSALFAVLERYILSTRKIEISKKARYSETLLRIATEAYLVWGVFTIDSSIREKIDLDLIITEIVLAVMCALFYFSSEMFLLYLGIVLVGAAMVFVLEPGQNITAAQAFNGTLFVSMLAILGGSRYNFALKAYIAQSSLEKANEELFEADSKHKMFTAAMNHELRTPLNGIIGTLQVMQLKEGMDAEEKGNINQCMSSSRSMLSIVNDLLDFYKLDAGEFEIHPDKFDLFDNAGDLRRQFKNMAEKKGLAISLKVPEDTVCGLIGDKVRLNQIASNIISNAIKYTDKGSITVSLGYEQDHILFEVADTGQGMPEEALPSLFEPFKRVNEAGNSKIQGTGLGLAIVKMLVDTMKGEISVESKLGTGSTFRIKIHADAYDPENLWKDHNGNISANEPVKKTIIKLSGKKIIYIDDNMVNLTVFKKLIGETEAEVTLKSNPNDGLNEVLNNRFDLIFIDHMMPEMDGLELFSKVRTSVGPNKNTPAVILTGNLSEEAKKQYSAEGFDGYLSKPVMRDDLLELTAKLLKI